MSHVKENFRKEMSLKDGHFDEEESHNLFLEALNSWRNP